MKVISFLFSTLVFVGFCCSNETLFTDGTENRQLSFPQSESLTKRNIINATWMYWPNGVIPFIIDPKMGKKMSDRIFAAISEFENHTCVRFPARATQLDYVLFKPTVAGCASSLGRREGKQVIALSERDCKLRGSIMHEMMHTLGFNHEQSRRDRDRYIKINYENMEKGMYGQFDMLNPGDEETFGFPYDYMSLMHYPQRAFSKNGLPTITTTDPRYQNLIGQRRGFSCQDIMEIRALYKCENGALDCN